MSYEIVIVYKQNETLLKSKFDNFSPTEDNGRWSKIMKFLSLVFNSFCEQKKIARPSKAHRMESRKQRAKEPTWKQKNGNVKELWSERKRKREKKKFPARCLRASHLIIVGSSTQVRKKSTERIQKFTEPSSRANERDFYALLLLWKTFFFWLRQNVETVCMKFFFLRFIEPDGEAK